MPQATEIGLRGLNLHRHDKLRSEKAFKEAAGMGMPVAEAQFMITSKAANTVWNWPVACQVPTTPLHRPNSPIPDSCWISTTT